MFSSVVLHRNHRVWRSCCNLPWLIVVHSYYISVQFIIRIACVDWLGVCVLFPLIFRRVFIFSSILPGIIDLNCGFSLARLRRTSICQLASMHCKNVRKFTNFILACWLRIRIYKTLNVSFLFGIPFGLHCCIVHGKWKQKCSQHLETGFCVGLMKIITTEYMVSWERSYTRPPADGRCWFWANDAEMSKWLRSKWKENKQQNIRRPMFLSNLWVFVVEALHIFTFARVKLLIGFWLANSTDVFLWHRSHATTAWNTAAQAMHVGGVLVWPIIKGKYHNQL